VLEGRKRGIKRRSYAEENKFPKSIEKTREKEQSKKRK